MTDNVILNEENNIILNTDADINTNANANVNVNINADADINTNANVNVNINANADINTNADVNTNANTNANANADANANVNVNVNVNANADVNVKYQFLSHKELYQCGHSYLNTLTSQIYNDFKHFIGIKNLNHNKGGIMKTLSSPYNFFIRAYVETNNKKQVIGYLLGEIMDLRPFDPTDKRIAAYINYIFVNINYRNKGVGGNMLDLAYNYFSQQNLIKDPKIDNIMLKFDTIDQTLYRFYTQRNFKKDYILASQSQYDTFSKQIKNNEK